MLNVSAKNTENLFEHILMSSKKQCTDSTGPKNGSRNT